MLLQVVAMFPRDAFCIEPEKESMLRAIQGAGLTPTPVDAIFVPHTAVPYANTFGVYVSWFRLADILEPQSGTLYWLRATDRTVKKIHSMPFKDENLGLLVANATLFWPIPDHNDRIAILIGE